MSSIMVIALLLDCLLTVTALVGFFFNVYILVSVLLSKQLSRPANVLIFHMSILFSVLTLSFILLTTPTLFKSDPSHFQSGHIVCVFHGFVNLIFHPVALWTVAGIHLDRFISIANPLRYSSILTRRKCACYLGLSWTVVIVACVPPMMAWPPMAFRQPMGSCAPMTFGSNPFFPVGYVSLTILVPLCIVTGVNMRITSIAKHHRFRIANALFGMTLGSAAQHMQTEGARARDQQEKALKRFEGKNAIGTLTQLVGTLFLAYLPTVTITLFETFSNRPAHPLALKATLLCLLTAPPVNSFIFGIRNKSVQMILINFMRKEFYKNEVQQEIRLRSPGLAGSTRPSVTSIVGQITCQVPYLQRQVSVASLVPLNCNGKPMNPTIKNLNNKPPMVRHSSDLSWRISTLKEAAGLNASIATCNKAESSNCINRCPSKGSLTVPSNDSILNINTNPVYNSSKTNCQPTTKVNPSRRRLSLNLVTNIFQQNSDQIHAVGNAVMLASRTALLNQCDIEMFEDGLSLSGSEAELPKPRSAKSTYSATTAANFSSPSALTNAVRCICQKNYSTGGRKAKPKITITRVPTVDQSSLEFLYPLDYYGTVSPERIVLLESSDELAKHEETTYLLEDIVDVHQDDGSETIDEKERTNACQPSKHDTKEPQSGYINGLYSLCQEVII